ncbi:MAG: hypothetical protein AB1758_22115 [Candidatus Eremiobacterota bacterium]
MGKGCSGKLRGGKGKVGRSARVSPRKGPQARKRKGNAKRRQGHTKPRMSGRKHKAIRKRLFQQALLIQAEQACSQARMRRRRAWLVLAWRLTKRILRPMLTGLGRWGLRQAPHPVPAPQCAWMAMAPPPAFPMLPPPVREATSMAWGFEEEALGLEVGATVAGGCLPAGLTPLMQPSGVRALRPSTRPARPIPPLLTDPSQGLLSA